MPDFLEALWNQIVQSMVWRSVISRFSWIDLAFAGCLVWALLESLGSFPLRALLKLLKTFAALAAAFVFFSPVVAAAAELLEGAVQPRIQAGIFVGLFLVCRLASGLVTGLLTFWVSRPETVAPAARLFAMTCLLFQKCLLLSALVFVILTGPWKSPEKALSPSGSYTGQYFSAMTVFLQEQLGAAVPEKTGLFGLSGKRAS